MREEETEARRARRLKQEQLCADIFQRLIRGALKGAPFSLLLFDFGNGANDELHISYTTTRSRSVFAEQMAVMVEAWKTGKPRTAPAFQANELMSEQEARGLSQIVDMYVPEGMGFAVVIGSVAPVAYISSGDRPGMLATFEELIPKIIAESN